MYHLLSQTPEGSTSLTSSLATDNTSSSVPLNDHTLLATPSIAGKGTHMQFAHILQKDAFLVFRSLCKLSMKGISDVHDSR